jgi:dipeptidyl aminopeptidase/acylaminoacyl peptidase
MLRYLFPLLLAVTAPAQRTGIFDLRGDLGVTPKKGSLEFNPATGEYRITGGGANIWATADAGYFLWTRVTGDVQFSADVSFVGTGAVAHRKAVLMVRQDLTPDAAYADVAIHGDGMASLQYRPSAGAQTLETRSALNGATRLRLERRGNGYTMFVGKPGEEMVSTGPQQVDLVGPVYVGIGVCSHDADILETAVFSHVQLGGRQATAAQQRYRSKITIFDLASRATSTRYTADQVIEAPNWSRDGRFLLVNTGGNLYRLPVEGEAKLEQIDLGSEGYRCNNDHDFTRDGKRLAFSASSLTSRQSQVYLAGGDGSGAKLMTPLAPSYFHGWSPDAKWLAFVGQRDNKFTLFRVPVEGGAEQRLTSKGYDDGPEYSPDGKFIYFNSNRTDGWDIWRIPADGGGPGDARAERVTNDEVEDWFPHFSPNGKWLLIFGFPHGTANHNDKMEGVVLRLMPAPGKTLKPAKPEELVKFFGGQGTINVNSWSPDSKKFAYVVYEKL